MEFVYCRKEDHDKRQIIGICTSRGCQQERACCTQCILGDHTFHNVIEFRDPEKDYTDIATLYNQLKNIILTSSNEQSSIAWIDDLPEFPNLSHLNSLGNVLGQLGIDDRDLSRVKWQFESSINSKSLDAFNIYKHSQSQCVYVDPMALLKEDQYSKALDASDSLIQQYPHWHLSWYYKALTLFLMGIFNNDITTNYEEILECNQKALELRPNDFEALRLKGNILEAMNNHYEARQINTLALLSSNNLIVNLYRIGHHYEDMKSTLNQQYRHRQSLNTYY